MLCLFLPKIEMAQGEVSEGAVADEEIIITLKVKRRARVSMRMVEDNVP